MTLTASDIEKFRKLVKTSKKFPSSEPGHDSRAWLKPAEADLNGKTYQLENLQAEQIIGAMAEAFKFEDRAIVFPRNASLAGWPRTLPGEGPGRRRGILLRDCAD